MPDAIALRNEIERRYDGEIPPEALAAIAAAEQAEREARLTARLSPEARLRFLAAKEFRLAKGCFRTLARLTRQGTIRPTERPAPGEWKNTFQQLRENARLRACPHLEAFAALRHQERRAA
ncbi:MAG TPA: hypothetical protein VHA35_00125 [Dongiaceae bacterium]|jgi:hypothetical protein|nr:hypothetical protein [Steroidobacteraceae bacterium]HVY97873.1 hypothetical protein [Dongiaceae bacterium]